MVTSSPATRAIGGVKTDLSTAGRDELRAHLGRLKADFESLVTLLIDSGSFTDRIDGTGTLSPEAARDLGVAGLAARASGLDEDLRPTLADMVDRIDEPEIARLLSRRRHSARR